MKVERYMLFKVKHDLLSLYIYKKQSMKKEKKQLKMFFDF